MLSTFTPHGPAVTSWSSTTGRRMARRRRDAGVAGLVEVYADVHTSAGSGTAQGLRIQRGDFAVSSTSLRRPAGACACAISPRGCTSRRAGSPGASTASSARPGRRATDASDRRVTLAMLTDAGQADMDRGGAGPRRRRTAPLYREPRPGADPSPRRRLRRCALPAPKERRQQDSPSLLTHGDVPTRRSRWSRRTASAESAKDRDRWLSLFAPDATHEDPVGAPVNRHLEERSVPYFDAGAAQMDLDLHTTAPPHRRRQRGARVPRGAGGSTAPNGSLLSPIVDHMVFDDDDGRIVALQGILRSRRHHPQPGVNRARDVYTLGHHESVLRSHRWRTAENSADYLFRRPPGHAY